MTTDLAADVLICGTDTAGLTLAIDLARRGVSFRLIEKLDDPFRDSCGKGIGGEAAALETYLENVGLDVERMRHA